MIDLEIPAQWAERRDRIRSFVEERIVPYEKDPRLTRHGPNEELRAPNWSDWPARPAC